MDVRNSIENLTQVLQTSSSTLKPTQKGAGVDSKGAVSADHDQDTAQVSSTAAQISKTSAEPEVRLDKVASIQSALQSGTYQVPAEKVAQKVIASMLSKEK